MITPSSIPNKDLMTLALERLSGQWRLALLFSALYFGLYFGLGNIPFVGFFATWTLGAVLTYGHSLFFLGIARGKKMSVSTLFSGRSEYWKLMGVFWLSSLLMLLWGLLFIIPGILAMLSYSMVFYVAADNRELGVYDILRRSKALMEGNRWKLITLHLRFSGWWAFTLIPLVLVALWLVYRCHFPSIVLPLFMGIGGLFISPYIQVSTALFYQTLLDNEIQSHAVEPGDIATTL